MPKLEVAVFELGKDFNCFKLGEIIWDGNTIRVDPSNDRDLQQIAAKSYWLGTVRAVKEFSPKDNPESWISNLHKRYSSQHIRVSKVTSTEVESV
jgi:hypothetical protein